MNANVMDLRRRPAKILEAIEKREAVLLSKRGKPVARIVPLEADKKSSSVKEHAAFGMWSDCKESVPEQIRAMRKGRFDAL